MTAIAMGVHVLDVLVRPVEAIPEGQGGQLVEEIRVTAAGSAGGTALTLAKLGAEVRSAGAIGTDAVGDMLIAAARAATASTPRCWSGATEVQTSASVLPIRPERRPAGLPRDRRQRDLRPPTMPRWTRSPRPLTCTSAGPSSWAARRRRRSSRARARSGVVTSADLLAPGDPGLLEWIGPALAHLDYLLPNDEQVLGFTRRRRPRCRLPRAGRARRRLRRRDPRRRRRADRRRRRGRARSPPSRSRSSTRPAAATPSRPASCAAWRSVAAAATPRVLGCAAAALVAQGLGTDHGDFDLAAADAFAASAAPII